MFHHPPWLRHWGHLPLLFLLDHLPLFLLSTPLPSLVSFPYSQASNRLLRPPSRGAKQPTSPLWVWALKLPIGYWRSPAAKRISVHLSSKFHIWWGRYHSSFGTRSPLKCIGKGKFWTLVLFLLILEGKSYWPPHLFKFWGHVKLPCLKWIDNRET